MQNPSPVSASPRAAHAPSPTTPTARLLKTVRRDTASTSGSENRLRTDTGVSEDRSGAAGQVTGRVQQRCPSLEHFPELTGSEQHCRNNSEREAAQGAPRCRPEPTVEREPQAASADHADRARRADPEHVARIGPPVRRWAGFLLRIWMSVHKRAVPRQSRSAPVGSTEFLEFTQCVAHRRLTNGRIAANSCDRQAGRSTRSTSSHWPGFTSKTERACPGARRRGHRMAGRPTGGATGRHPRRV